MYYSNVKAVAIDLDGTLLDTIGEIVLAANLMLSRFKVEPLSDDLIKSFVGKGIAHLVQQLLTASDLQTQQQSAVNVFEAAYLEVVNSTVRPYPGVVDGLKIFKAAGIPMVVATNKAMLFSKALLEGQDIAKYFSHTFAGDSVEKKKPHAMMLLACAKALGVEPHQMLMIGDSANDVQAARSAGCPVAVMNYGYREGATVESLQADGVFSSIADIAKLVAACPTR